MTKYKGQLYLLVTDQGFLTEEKTCLGKPHIADGDGNFCDSEFQLQPPSDPETVHKGPQNHMDQDHLTALSLQQEQQGQEINWEETPERISDLELARKLGSFLERKRMGRLLIKIKIKQHSQLVPASPSSGKQHGILSSNERNPEKEKEKEKKPAVKS
uniref:Ubiquitin carboxyl-terminal hydrolase n=1 Tax=Oryctolagus cuniculus TaxID=9986 RepID=A0A5F9C2X0_RABIT